MLKVLLHSGHIPNHGSMLKLFLPTDTYVRLGVSLEDTLYFLEE